MKVAIFGESSADEAAIRVLVERILGRIVDVPPMPFIVRRGYQAVIRDLPMVLKHLHYRTDSDALVVVLDSDLSSVHVRAHGGSGGTDPECRFCEVQAIIGQVRQQLGARSVQMRLKTAIGLAVPQIEAWYVVGKDPHVNEATWGNALKSKNFPYTSRRLKQIVYNTDHPLIAWETQRAQEEASRIVRDGHLLRLETLFPGFAVLAEAVRSW